MEKKKRQKVSGSPKREAPIKKSSKDSQTEKKKKKYPKSKVKRSSTSKLSSQTNKIKNLKKRETVVNKNRYRKKRSKRVRTQYSKRYNV